MKNAINLTFKIVVIVLIEIVVAVLTFKVSMYFMPDIYSDLVETMNSNVATAVLVVAGMIAILSMYRVSDSVDKLLDDAKEKKRTKIGKDGAKNDFNNQKERSSSNELTHEHNA